MSINEFTQLYCCNIWSYIFWQNQIGRLRHKDKNNCPQSLLKGFVQGKQSFLLNTSVTTCTKRYQAIPWDLDDCNVFFGRLIFRVWRETIKLKVGSVESARRRWLEAWKKTINYSFCFLSQIYIFLPSLKARYTLNTLNLSSFFPQELEHFWKNYWLVNVFTQKDEKNAFAWQ